MTENKIREIIDRETQAWDTQDVKLLLTVFHPDMVWPWPKNPQAHDPMDWVLDWGRYNHDRWGKGWQELFDTHELVRNDRVTKKILTNLLGMTASQRRSRFLQRVMGHLQWSI